MVIKFFGLKFNKNKYDALRFLSQHHNIVLRVTLGILGFSGTFIVTRSRALATQSYHDFKNDDFKIAFRRAAKILKLYKNQSIVKDDTFNFCENLNSVALKDLQWKFRSLMVNDNFDLAKHGDYLYVLGGLIEQEDNAAHISEFEQISNKILLLVRHSWQHKQDDNTEKVTPSPSATSALNPMHAYSALQDWAYMFPIEDMRWFVVSGTFLGLIREGAFLAHDYDIDFGIHEDDFNFEKFKTAVTNSKTFFIKKIDFAMNGGFKQGSFRFQDVRQPVLIKIIHKTGINIDFFIHFKEKSQTGISVWHGSSYHRWDNSPFDLKEYTFIDIPVLGPNDHDRYLTENYGDWRTPVKDFHFNTGTPNLTLQKNPSSLALFIKRISEFRSRKSYITNINILSENGYISDDGVFKIPLNYED